MAGRVAIKRSGDNDPRKGRGARNFRGSEKRKQDLEKANHPEWFTESVNFLLQNYGKEVDNASVNNPVFLKKIVARLLSESDLNRDWLYQVYKKL